MAGVMPLGSRERSRAGLLILDVVSSVLTELVASSPQKAQSFADDGNAGQKPKVTKFHGLRAPSISVPNYLQRISKFSGCSNECFILSLIYIDRLITRRKIVMDTLNVHRLIITSIMLAAVLRRPLPRQPALLRGGRDSEGRDKRPGAGVFVFDRIRLVRVPKRLRHVSQRAYQKSAGGR